MSSVDRSLAITHAGCMHTDPVAQICTTPWLVESNPARDAVSQAPGHELSIIGEGIGGSAIDPATGLLQRRGEVPMIEWFKGLNAFRPQRVHQAFIQIQADRGDGATPLPHDAP